MPVPALALQNKQGTTLGYADHATFEPIPENGFKYACLQDKSEVDSRFKPDYKVINDKVIELPYSVKTDINTVSSLLDIGNILFEDSRDLYPDELNAMHSYIKKKYKKIRR